MAEANRLQKMTLMKLQTICFIIVSMYGHLHYTVYTSSSEHLPAVLQLYQGIISILTGNIGRRGLLTQ